MANKKKFVWSAKRVEKLRELREKGKTFAKIGAEMGASSSVVMNKAKNLGIKSPTEIATEKRLESLMTVRQIDDKYKKKYKVNDYLNWEGKKRRIVEVGNHFLSLDSRETVSYIDLHLKETKKKNKEN